MINKSKEKSTFIQVNASVFLYFVLHSIFLFFSFFTLFSSCVCSCVLILSFMAIYLISLVKFSLFFHNIFLCYIELYYILNYCIILYFSFISYYITLHYFILSYIILFFYRDPKMKIWLIRILREKKMKIKKNMWKKKKKTIKLSSQNCKLEIQKNGFHLISIK